MHIHIKTFVCIIIFCIFTFYFESTMKKIILLAYFTLSLFVLKAEINVGNSVEWLCADANLIAVGTLKSYSKSSTDNFMYVCTFESTEIIFGTTISPVVFSIHYIAEDSLKKYELQQIPMLVFLKENKVNPKSKETKIQWNIMEAYNSLPAFVNLTTPQQLLITATDFSVFTNREKIILYCRQTLKMIAEYQIMGKTVFKNYLEVPYQTTAFNLLYSGSSCYLYVPDLLFPKSKEKMF